MELMFRSGVYFLFFFGIMNAILPRLVLQKRTPLKCFFKLLQNIFTTKLFGDFGLFWFWFCVFHSWFFGRKRNKIETSIIFFSRKVRRSKKIDWHGHPHFKPFTTAKCCLTFRAIFSLSLAGKKKKSLASSRLFF